VVNCAAGQPITVSCPRSGGLADRRFDERGVLTDAALPPDDAPSESVDDERGIDEHPRGQPDVGEVGHDEPGGGIDAELAVHRVGRAYRVGIGDGGADLLASCYPLPAAGPRQSLHGAAGHLDAVSLQVGPHLRGTVERLRLPPAVLVGLVVAGEDLGHRHVPQGPL
jgi:hypothetical protein